MTTYQAGGGRNGAAHAIVVTDPRVASVLRAYAAFSHHKGLYGFGSMKEVDNYIIWVLGRVQTRNEQRDVRTPDRLLESYPLSQFRASHADS